MICHFKPAISWGASVGLWRGFTRALKAMWTELFCRHGTLKLLAGDWLVIFTLELFQDELGHGSLWWSRSVQVFPDIEDSDLIGQIIFDRIDSSLLDRLLLRRWFEAKEVSDAAKVRIWSLLPAFTCCSVGWKHATRTVKVGVIATILLIFLQGCGRMLVHRWMAFVLMRSISLLLLVLWLHQFLVDRLEGAAGEVLLVDGERDAIHARPFFHTGLTLREQRMANLGVFFRYVHIRLIYGASCCLPLIAQVRGWAWELVWLLLIQAVGSWDRILVG